MIQTAVDQVRWMKSPHRLIVYTSLYEATWMLHPTAKIRLTLTLFQELLFCMLLPLILHAWMLGLAKYDVLTMLPPCNVSKCFKIVANKISMVVDWHCIQLNGCLVIEMKIIFCKKSDCTHFLLSLFTF